VDAEVSLLVGETPFPLTTASADCAIAIELQEQPTANAANSPSFLIILPSHTYTALVAILDAATIPIARWEAMQLQQ
jgi:hypothetical protein